MAAALRPIAFALLALPFSTAESTQDVEEIARGILIGQTYSSGSAYMAGFVEDAARPWPRHITISAMRTPQPQYRKGAFARSLTADDLAELDEMNQGIDDLFSTMDRMPISDAPLAVYGTDAASESISVIGWDDTLALSEISFQQRDQPRPMTGLERREMVSQRPDAPKDIECTTVPQWLDSAKIILTGKIAAANATIRLSQYQNPGCLGHLSMIYVLDVIPAAGGARRFEFRHYQGLL